MFVEDFCIIALKRNIIIRRIERCQNDCGIVQRLISDPQVEGSEKSYSRSMRFLTHEDCSNTES